MRNMDDLEKTLQTPTPDNPDSTEEPSSPSLWKTVRWFILGLVVIVLVAAGIGYTAGLTKKETTRSDAIEQVSHEQFALALEDLNEGRYALAKQRLEYIISLNPMYPNIAETLAQALVQLNGPTATPMSMVNATATPNLAPIEDLLTQIQEAYRAKNWDQVIDTILVLRAKDPGYEAITIDGYLFDALRNRGLNRISKEGLLEEGIYDLSLAEQFGPLDSEAQNWRDWAELYILANSFYGVDWGNSAYYFSQLFTIAPYLKNDTYLKYAVAAAEYGIELYAAHDPCAAVDYFDQSLTAYDDQELYPTATKARVACRTATARPPQAQPTDTPEVTADPGGGDPTEETEPTPEG
ncbi:MAG: hypothetical protein JXA25_00080 [Anaerolineales bacterium]|nr:hypothetical protein [Anaerolineales bacterium]